MTSKIALIFALVLFTSAQAFAIPIPGLFSTGVDDAGNALTIGTADPHYSLMDSSLTARAITPHPAWENDPSVPAQWINPAENNLGTTNLPAGDYAYNLTFDLSGLIASSATVTGRWATDNSATLLLNNNPTGFTTTVRGFEDFSLFTLDSGFLAGQNTLTFLVNNAGTGNNPTGLFVDVSGDAAVIPEPSTVLLIGIGCLGLWGMSRSRRKSS